MRNIFKTVLLPLATLVVGVVSAASIHTAVAGPSASPPYNNVSSPINTGAISQVKKGLLGLGALTTDKLDGYQLFVKGKTKLQGDTDIVGGTRVEGTLNVTQDAYAKQFCLPGDKGGCVNSWDGMGSKIVGAGAMFWDPYRQQSSFYCEKFSWDGTDTYSYKDGKTVYSGTPPKLNNEALCGEETSSDGKVRKFLACPSGSHRIEIFRDLVPYDPTISNTQLNTRTLLTYPYVRSVYFCVRQMFIK